MLIKCVLFFDHHVAVGCDAKCDKAWGINSRPRHQLSDDTDDYETLADDELGVAPTSPGTSEGGHCKPVSPGDRLNKWCVRECERSAMADLGEMVELTDFSVRARNKQPTI